MSSMDFVTSQGNASKSAQGGVLLCCLFLLSFHTWYICKNSLIGDHSKNSSKIEQGAVFSCFYLINVWQHVKSWSCHSFTPLHGYENL